jgi:Spy/CpxP family protein refolding chaperone
MRLLPALLIGASMLLAQGPGDGPQLLPLPPGGPGRIEGMAGPQIDELKRALGLTDQQVAVLQQTLRDRQTALQPLREHIAERQRMLARAWESETDPAAIGHLVIEIRNLNAQVPQVTKRYQEQARAVLTPEQQPRLKALEDAMKLRPAIDAAFAYGLLEPEGRMQNFLVGAPGFPGAPVFFERAVPATGGMVIRQRHIGPPPQP